MKKLFLFALLAIAGITTASASTSFQIYCNGEMVYEDEELIIADDVKPETIQRYIEEMTDIFCEE